MPDVILFFYVPQLVRHLNCVVALRLLQVRHLFDTGESREMRIEMENVINSSTPKLARNGLCLVHFCSVGDVMCRLIRVGLCCNH